MKKILITGAGSYVGKSVQAYLSRWPERYQADAVGMSDGAWQGKSFHGYDVVFHVAGIAHVEKAKSDPAQAELYDRVNHRLAVETADKAKAAGVKQFVFMSSASVYGLTASVGQEIMITKDTPLRPVENYGLSKLRAEEELSRREDDHFRLAIVRPPMIYGKGCKGNYTTLAKLAKTMPAFPWVENRRSMLYIENLAEFIRLLIDDEAQGIFCPQNREYVCTSDMVSQIAHANGRDIIMVKGFAWALKLTRHITSMADKAFGSLCYDRELSRYPKDYWVKDFPQSIWETEGR